MNGPRPRDGSTQEASRERRVRVCCHRGMDHHTQLRYPQVDQSEQFRQFPAAMVSLHNLPVEQTAGVSEEEGEESTLGRIPRKLCSPARSWTQKFLKHTLRGVPSPFIPVIWTDWLRSPVIFASQGNQHLPEGTFAAVRARPRDHEHQIIAPL